MPWPFYLEIDSAPIGERYYLAGTPTQNQLAGPGAIYPKNILYAIPWFESRGHIVEKIGALVSFTGKIRFGIYDSLAIPTAPYPNNLLIDTGELSATGFGAIKGNISVTLEAETPYFFVMLTNVNATVTNLGAPGLFLGVVSTDFSKYYTHYTSTFAYAALPAIFPLGASIAAQPLDNAPPGIGVSVTTDSCP
jgi:hypothetical protein